MESGGWMGLLEPRPLDALSLAMLADAWYSPPFERLDAPAMSPTVDLTVHFRAPLPRNDPDELVLLHLHTGLLRDGFFEVDAEIWAQDGTLLCQARQLAVLIPVQR
jgi:acyl-CoA thioesterase